MQNVCIGRSWNNWPTCFTMACWPLVFAGCTEPELPKVDIRSPDGEQYLTRIYEWKFNRVRDAILSEFAEDGNAVEMSTLIGQVEGKIPVEEWIKIGKPGWFIPNVIFELEARKELQREQISELYFIKRVSSQNKQASKS